MKYLLLALFTLPCLAQLGESFHLEILNDRFVVTSPSKWFSEQHVIIKNKTLLPYRMRTSNDNGESLFITVQSGEHKSIQLPEIKGVRTSIVPLSPPGQEIFFRISEKPYEIPEKN